MATSQTEKLASLLRPAFYSWASETFDRMEIAKFSAPRGGVLTTKGKA